ncbi:MAG: DUF4296 domain-containing protein [Flavobacteriales bacterium]|jgi:hypothetical protein
MRIFIFIFGILTILACSNGQKKKRVASIEKNKFMDVMVDVRLLEGTYTIRYQRIDSTNGLMNAYYDQVFNKHQVSRKDFEDSYVAYSLDSKQMIEIEDSVLARLQRIVIETDTIKK